MVNILTRLMTEPVITYSSLDCLYRISCQVPLHNDRCVKAGEPIFGEPAWGPWEESECAGLDHYLYCTPRLRTACNLPFLPLPLSSVTRALFRIVTAALAAAAPLSLFVGESALAPPRRPIPVCLFAAIALLPVLLAIAPPSFLVALAPPPSLVGLAPAPFAVPPALRPPRPHVLRGELTRVTVVLARAAHPQSIALVWRRLPQVESVWVSAWVDVDQHGFILLYQLQELPLQMNPKDTDGARSYPKHTPSTRVLAIPVGHLAKRVQAKVTDEVRYRHCKKRRGKAWRNAAPRRLPPGAYIAQPLETNT